ncbi:MAG: hypothetical protein U5K37_12055 [Natrialbaceae archaeon]|nr:hypothetical protein [Natrialbaceae archaeon]
MLSSYVSSVTFVTLVVASPTLTSNVGRVVVSLGPPDPNAGLSASRTSDVVASAVAMANGVELSAESAVSSSMAATVTVALVVFEMPSAARGENGVKV